MKRTSSFSVIAGSAITILFLIAGHSNALAQTKCQPVTEEMKKSFSQYVKKKYKLPPAMAITVTGVSAVENTCYSKLHFASADAQQPLDFDLYLSPDRRFLTRDLSDTLLDPGEEETKKAEQLRASLTKGNVPILGPKDAAVTIVVFSDFQCPFCKNAAEMLKQVASSDSNIRIVFRHLPLRMHPWARQAAEATACAQLQSNQAFWKLHDMIFENQPGFTVANIQGKVLEYAQTLSELDITAFQSCIASKGSSAMVIADEKLAAANEVAATPTLYINGYQQRGIRNIEQLRAMIRQRMVKTENNMGAK